MPVRGAIHRLSKILKTVTTATTIPMERAVIVFHERLGGPFGQVRGASFVLTADT